MKLKKIEKICKASRSVHIYDDVFTVGDVTGFVLRGGGVEEV